MNAPSTALPNFIQLPVSPWSEKARWALDHSHVAYESIEYIPTISTLAVRWQTKRFTSKLTIPILINGNDSFSDSWDIARYADLQRAEGIESLFPHDDLEAIEAWNAKSEEILGTLRLGALEQMKQNRQTQINALPDFFPHALRPYLWPVSWLAIQTLSQKYQKEGSHPMDVVEQHLQSLRNSLEKSGNDYILGSFSYADIVMCCSLQMVAPVADEFLVMDAQIREDWSNPQLKEAYQDLVEWRDRIYKKHRKQ
ncbi:MAG: glutathione S-transferase N-terminal domain-containing protein [Pseudomonadales bacterium]|nr:glutathione S-transferase N-terminal domain-containing protein [Pseudomonadales bacterium]